MAIWLLLLTYNGNTDVEGKGEGGTSRGEESEGTGQGETGDV
jgi:hypothetical protein